MALFLPRVKEAQEGERPRQGAAPSQPCVMSMKEGEPCADILDGLEKKRISLLFF